jgi:toxin ParE1/3/4
VRREVVWSRDALNELSRAVAYIAQDNPAAARKVAAAIRKSGEILGERAVGRLGRVEGTFEKSVNGAPYIIAYTVDPQPAGDRIVILRVIHSSRRWEPEMWPT